MNNNNQEDTLTYKFFYNLSYIIAKSIKGLLSLLYNGIVKSSKNYKFMISVYVLLTLLTIVGYLYSSSVGAVFLTIILGVALIFGIYYYNQDKPARETRKIFYELFEEVQLYADDKILPCFLYSDIISEYCIIYSFKTLIPLEMWNKKKNQMEIILNGKILDIYHTQNDLQVVNVVIQHKPLPEYIEWNDEYINTDKNILNIGMSCYGLEGLNLDSYPHAFIAGETGSGKSNILKCLIHQSILKGYEVVLIDFKRGVSFANFIDTVKIYYDYTTVIEVIKSMVEETSKRLDLFREYKVDNLKDYNAIATNPLKRIIIFIDELAELLKTRDKEISNTLNDSLETLTRLSRAVGINLIMGIQRPDSTIVNGQIKNNVPFRVCGRFTDKEPSRIMLASDVASTLPNIKGKFIIKDNELKEVQSFYFQNNTDNIIYKAVKSYNEDIKDFEEQEQEQEKEQEETEPPEKFDFDFSDLKN